jgi:hypothetical protein
VKRLLIRPGAIGDLIVSLPALEYLRADYTEVWTAGAHLSLIRFADRARSIAATGLDLVELGVPLPVLEQFDEIYSWYGTTRDAFRDAVLHLPFRFFTALPNDTSMHAADFYLAQVGAPLGALPRITCPAPEPTGRIVIHPFSGSVKKNWPLEKFRELAGSIGEVDWCAGPDEQLEGAHRFDDLHELGSWLAASKLYIGNDSGITHLAAACGARVIAIFGPTDPAVWAPRGPNVQVIRHQPLDELSVESVLQCI